MCVAGCAQSKNLNDDQAAYQQTIKLRSEKIVHTLSIADSNEASKVVDIIARQYHDLNAVHTRKDAELKALKNDTTLAKESRKVKQDAVQNDVLKQLDKLHKKYLRKLSSELTEEQIVQVKNGMTYNVLPITYQAYQDMIPTLTETQKAQILAWLTEAREHAMDAGSSDEKHAWFGKYKGRINNYLSAQGYNAQKEREEWEKRIKAKNGA
jgi:hypothetical protein